MSPATLHRILVASDFSDRSRAAEEAAIKLAEQFESTLIIVNAIEPIKGISGVDDDANEFNEFYQTLRNRSESEALARIERYKERNISADYHIEIGPRWLVILEQARLQDANLIVLGRRTYHQEAGFTFGTTSQKVFFGATCPTLFVPGDHT